MNEKNQNTSKEQEKECLTQEICADYRKQAKGINDHSMSNLAFARLSNELVDRCGITEVQAINILNGYFIKDYVAIQERLRNGDMSHNKTDDSREYLEWLAEKEAKENMLNDFDLPDKD
jgi:hypothetical protein